MIMVKKLIRKYQNMPPALRAGLWFTICNFLQKGISFITVPIFTRLLTTEEYGLYSVYTSWHSIMTIFATLQLSYYVFNKGLVKYENDRDEFVVSIQSLSGVITLALMVLYVPFKDFIYIKTGMPTVLMLCMIVQIFFEPPVAYWTSRKRFEYDYRSVLIVTLGIAVTNPLFGIILIKSHLFENAALARVFSISLVTAVAGCVFAINIIKRGRKVISRKYWLYALAFNIPLIPHFLSSTILNQADRIMIERMTTKTNAALYSVAYSAAMVCNLFAQAIQQAFLPWLYQKMSKKEYGKIPAIINVFLIFMLAILTMIICFAPEIIWILGSSKYAEAIWVIPPVCGSVFFIFMQNFFANVEYYFEKTKVIALASVGVAMLNIALNYIFINKYGYLAAGYTTLFCYLAYSITHFLLMRRLCKANDVDVSQLFDLKMVMILSIITLMIVFIMVSVYSYLIMRYSILIVILIGLLLSKNRIKHALITIKSDQGK